MECQYMEKISCICIHAVHVRLVSLNLFLHYARQSNIKILTYCLSRVDHDLKIRNRRQRMDTGKYTFVNRTI